MISLLSLHCTPSAISTGTFLYQYEVCPFCCKVKAFLDFQGLPYRTVEVHPISKSQLKFSTKYKKVPVLMADGVQCNDSNEIINSLTALLAREGRPRGGAGAVGDRGP